MQPANARPLKILITGAFLYRAMEVGFWPQPALCHLPFLLMKPSASIKVLAFSLSCCSTGIDK